MPDYLFGFGLFISLINSPIKVPILLFVEINPDVWTPMTFGSPVILSSIIIGAPEDPFSVSRECWNSNCFGDLTINIFPLEHSKSIPYG